MTDVVDDKDMVEILVDIVDFSYQINFKNLFVEKKKYLG